MILAFVTVICTVFMAVQTPLIARAESIEYSEVLDDLKKDASFQESNYPERPTDYSLNIIQIAESVNKELFVYVYQPSAARKNRNKMDKYFRIPELRFRDFFFPVFPMPGNRYIHSGR